MAAVSAWKILFKIFKFSSVSADYEFFRNRRPEYLWEYHFISPAGNLSDVLYEKKKAVKSLLAVFGISLFFEAFQYAAIGATDIDDIILNCAGGLFGVMCYKVLLFVCMGKEEKAKTAVAGTAAVVGMITAVLIGLLIAFN